MFIMKISNFTNELLKFFFMVKTGRQLMNQGPFFLLVPANWKVAVIDSVKTVKFENSIDKKSHSVKWQLMI